MNKSVWLSVAVGVLAVLGWWVLSNPAEQSAGDVAPLTEAEAETQADPRLGASSLPVVSDEPAREAVSVDFEPVARASERVFAQWPEEGDELQLFADGEPAGGAQVCLLHEADGDLSEMIPKLSFGSGELDQGQRDRGTWYLADEDGHVRIAHREEAILVAIEHGQLRGYWATSSPPFEGTRVDLLKPRGAVVRVLDELSGGVPGAEIVFGGNYLMWYMRGAQTDGNGDLELSNVNVLLGCIARSEGTGGGSTLEVSTPAWGQAAGAAQASFDAMDPPGQPIVLQVKGSGSCEVRIVNEFGEALEGGELRVTLELGTESKTGRQREAVRGPDPALFQRIPLGSLVQARAKDADLDSPLSVAEGVVRGAGDGALKLTLVIPSRFQRFGTGRLVNGQGEPLINASAQVTLMSIQGGGSGTSRGSLSTDEGGLFTYSVNVEGGPDSVGTFEVSIRLEQPGLPTLFSNLEMFTAPFELPFMMGDVLMEPAPLLAAGLVVDGRGNPVAGATVELLELQALENGGTRRRKGLAQGSEETGSDGAFQLFGHSREQNLALTVQVEGYQPNGDTYFQQGAKGVRLVVLGAGSLMGSFEVLEGFPITEFSMGIQPADPALREDFSPSPISGGWSSDSHWWDSSLNPEGEFGWHDLPAGFYNLRLKGDVDQRGPLQVWNGIEVLAGEINRDSRLQEIPLPGAGEWIEVVLVGQAGDPIKGGMCKVIANASNDDEAGEWNPVKRVLTGDADYISVVAPGFLKATVAIERPITEVRLQRAPQVILQLPATLELGQGKELSVRLDPVGPQGALKGMPSLPSGSQFQNGEALVPVRELGRQQVMLTVSKSTGEFSTRSVMLNQLEIFIDVGSADDGKRIPIALSALTIKLIMAF